jgi:hypothetical protein
LLAWVALAGQVGFVVAWIVAGALQPRYSSLHQPVSELAARHAAYPWIVTAGIAVLGVAMAALGLALYRVLPRRPAATLTALLFAAAGGCVVVTAAVPLDCGLSSSHCRDLWRAGQLSWHEDGHIWAAFASEVLFTLTPFTIARALWPGPAGAAALSSGAFGVAFGAVSAALSSNVPDGALQRVDLFVLHLWVLILVAAILYGTRHPARPSPLIPLRPRDFLARSWRGEGALLVRPLFLGRRLARTFGARREATWISERVWRIDDHADFGGGRVMHRQMFCEFVADDHLHISAGDLPDGIDVWLEEGGYRTSEFRMNFPLGPIPVLIHCRDRSYVDTDGTFVNAIDALSVPFGFPLARVVFRVRPVLAAPRAAPATAAVASAPHESLR